MTIRQIATSMMVAVSAGLISGCESPDGRLAQFAERAAEQQARQNEATAQQSQIVAEQSKNIAVAAQQLVDRDAQARRELLDAHAKLTQRIQAEREGLNQQREDLTRQHDQLLAARIREPVIASAIESAAIVLAALLPLVVAIFALHRLGAVAPDQALGELLVQELVASDAERLLPGPLSPAPRRLEGQNDPET